MQIQAMPRWHMALFWWIGALPLAVFLALGGHYAVAAVCVAGFVFGSFLLAAFRDEANSLLCEWRLLVRMWLVMSLMLGSILVVQEFPIHPAWSFPPAIVSMYLFIRWGSALSRSIQTRSAPNYSLKRTNQSLRD